MKKFPILYSWTLRICIALFCFGHAIEAAKQPRTTVYSEVSRNYEREMLSSGKYKAETFAFGEGIMLDKGSGDNSLTALSFREICELIAPGLQDAQYVPTPGPEETDLMILVHWGKTTPYDNGLGGMAVDAIGEAMTQISNLDAMDLDMLDPTEAALSNSMAGDVESQLDMALLMQETANREREKANRYNANLLGYQDSMQDIKGLPPMFRGEYSELMYELENPRYFVILQAFDFQKLWKDKKKEILWITRFSIRARGNKFDEQIATMAKAASQSFGNKSGRLRRYARPSQVIMGDLEFLGVEEEE